MEREQSRFSGHLLTIPYEVTISMAVMSSSTMTKTEVMGVRAVPLVGV